MEAARTRSPKETRRIASTHPLARPNGPAVVVVEDSPTQSLRVRSALETGGFRVFVAGEPREAVELARRLDPAAVVASVELPRVDGFQLCTFFRSDPQLRRSAFLLIGAEHPAEERERATAVGAHAYVAKGAAQAIALLVREAMAVAEPAPAEPAAGG